MSPGAPGASTALVAVDTGGTFTDLVLLRDGTLSTLKVPSTPDDPAQAVLDALASVLEDGEAFTLLHGSTVATNALLERTGARVALVTNRGFEDVVEIGRQNRPQLYALVGRRPPPLVARGDRLGVAGRLGPDGAEVEPLDEAELIDLAASLQGRAQAVAVSLLHAYANPAHEQAVGSALAELDVPVSVSSDLLPEFREYERTATTVVNAYVGPIMERYLGRLSRESSADRVTIMGSNGGGIPVERARREPVQTVLSGPAGGVVGALTWAGRVGHEAVISFDMGGTSTDVSLCPGHPLRTREFEIADQPVAIPVIDIHTVGAGGGSIARVDPGGALRVGPRSAGADPGPISYGRGGTEVTVTDAHVWLGRLPPDAFLGGRRPLDRASIREPLGELAGTLGGSLEEAAEGVLSVADAAMERALRVISVERGFDPMDFTVVALGGAGALHVVDLAARLGARSAIVPPDPGLLSAYGMLAATVTRESSRTVLIGSDAADHGDRLRERLTELEASARTAMLDEGADPATLTSERWIDARYRGQSFELLVPAEEWIDRFHESHRERYGYERRETVVEAVTVRAVVRGPAPALETPLLGEAEGPPERRAADVVYGGRSLTGAIVRREDLRAGHVLDGPVVVQEYSGTTWVPPGTRLEVDRWACLHLTWNP